MKKFLNLRQTGMFTIIVAICALIYLFLITQSDVYDDKVSDVEILNDDNSNTQHGLIEPSRKNVVNRVESSVSPDFKTNLSYDENWCVAGQLNEEAKELRKAERSEWRRERGYFERHDKNIYRQYDEQVLADLSAEGDLLALDALIHHYLTIGKQPDKIEALMWKAASIGSTNATNKLAFRYALAAQKSVQMNNINAPSNEAQESLESALALYKISLSTGDFSAIETTNQILKKWENYGGKINWNSVNKRMTHFATKLEAVRLETGFNPPDMRVPKAIDRYNKYKLQGLLANGESFSQSASMFFTEFESEDDCSLKLAVLFGQRS